MAEQSFEIIEENNVENVKESVIPIITTQETIPLPIGGAVEGLAIETVQKVDFEKKLAEFRPDYSDLEAKGGYFVPFAKEMASTKISPTLNYTKSLSYKEYMLPMIEGLPFFSKMCLVYEDLEGKPVLMLQNKEYMDNSRTKPIHEDIYDSWEKCSKEKPDSDEANLFKRLRPRGMGLSPLHGYVVESTEGRQLVISDHSLNVYKNLAGKLYLEKDGTVVPDSQKWNLVKDMEKIANDVRMKEMFRV